MKPSPSSSSSPPMALETTTDDRLHLSDELDENGFPVGPLSSSSFDDGGGERRDDPQIETSIASTSDFASDFYRCGTDWSSLLEEPPAGKEIRGLVQRDLFQMWGIKKPADGWGSGSGVSYSSRKRRRTMIGGVGGGDCVDQEVPQLERMGFDRGSDRHPVCPFYKKIPGTPFTVDAFRYGPIEGCSAYFLSHFHHDHYGGLSKKWSHGPIYCTPLTARLVKLCLSINSLYICPLELDTEHVIEGTKVTLLEANHCPGAALIHFRLSNGQIHLHTGDFRACKQMQSYPLLLNHRINVLYLDTTYCNPKYRFPPKEDVVNFIVRTARKCLEKQPKTLIAVGAYSIGKEHVYVSISQALEVPIYTDSSRRRILQSFGWPELSRKLCSCGQSSPLHVLPISFLRHENLCEYLNTYKQQFAAVLAFRPTGWTYSGTTLDLIKPSSKGNITLYGVPYSEHSSFIELRDFVKFLKPHKIIPTVNVGNPTNREKMQAYFREWLKA
ncbi:DNA cross-link repair protein SNM1 [Elaeis guineensis]|uniref:DNA cross-link repair protein SNM1 n=1 Tax=Elaeis guineensis var. tenera TaxID=51953 RepID=A0A6J0PMJ0_ELAGV|nr:DNA cross-link repair protein SNM1 [Elaeis guineensis]